MSASASTTILSSYVLIVAVFRTDIEFCSIFTQYIIDILCKVLIYEAISSGILFLRMLFIMSIKCVFCSFMMTSLITQAVNKNYGIVAINEYDLYIGHYAYIQLLHCFRADRLNIVVYFRNKKHNPIM
jgi:hypothetical protein